MRAGVGVQPGPICITFIGQASGRSLSGSHFVQKILLPGTTFPRSRPWSKTYLWSTEIIFVPGSGNPKIHKKRAYLHLTWPPWIALSWAQSGHNQPIIFPYKFDVNIPWTVDSRRKRLLINISSSIKWSQLTHNFTLQLQGRSSTKHEKYWFGKYKSPC